MAAALFSGTVYENTGSGESLRSIINTGNNTVEKGQGSLCPRKQRSSATSTKSEGGLFCYQNGKTSIK